MSLSWPQRKSKLAVLLKSQGDEDADGTALDRILHGQNVIGKTSKTVEIDALRFQDKDLGIVGTLEFGQYGVIDVVTCRLNGGTYVRKSIEKRFALRTRDQCFPQFERDILLQSLKTNSKWAPHLLCAFQTPTHLNLVMDYAEGGSLWDVLESSPHSGKLPELDLQWWIPQIVSAIHWCHSQGFAHRDIKPQNFVLTQDAHILLIDFGSAAPLLPPGRDGSQFLPKRYCVVPCGTCDYISPEILRAHEEALVALETEDDEELPSTHSSQREEIGYGVETDWWSFGAMLYEMAYGVVPFFANEIRHTYQKIMNHEKSLRFDESIPVPSVYKDFIRKLLTHPEYRIGRHNITEITNHPVFEAVDWTNLHEQKAPPDLVLPQFTYSEQPPPQPEPSINSKSEDSLSKGFAFSALFQSSPAATNSSPGLSVLRPTPVKSAMQEDPSAAFIGFSWGPTRDAFASSPKISLTPPPSSGYNAPSTPLPTSLNLPSRFATPMFPVPTNNLLATPLQRFNTFSTPSRPYAFTPFRTNTLPRTAGSIQRTIQRRDLSDREAMKQLVDCVGMSARKKVLESGKKPKILKNPASLRSASGGFGTLRKELRFVGDPIPMPDYRSFSNASSLSSSNHSGAQDTNNTNNNNTAINATTDTIVSLDNNALSADNPIHTQRTNNRPAPITIEPYTTGAGYSGSEADYTDSEGPPSPSPRPASALSSSTATMTFTMMMGSSLSMRTPTSSMNMTNMTNSVGMGASSSGMRRSASGSSLLVPLTARSASFPSLLGVQDPVVVERKVTGERVSGKGKVPSERKVSGELVEEPRLLRKEPQETKGSRDGKVSGERRADMKRRASVGEGSSKVYTQSKEPPDRSEVFQKGSFDAANNGQKPDQDIGRRGSKHVAVERPASRRLDAYRELDKKLGLLIDNIGDLEERLAKVKVALH